MDTALLQTLTGFRPKAQQRCERATLSPAGQRQERARLEACLDRHHYLGYRSRVGRNLQYWVCDAGERPFFQLTPETVSCAPNSGFSQKQLATLFYLL